MGDMNKKGYNQGDMSPKVEDYQKPMSSYSQSQPGDTTNYISRQNSMVTGEASQIKKQNYKGRYS